MPRRALLAVALVLAAGVSSACGGGSDGTGVDGAPACGWDLRTDAGRQANAERLTFANEWLTAHAGEPVPAPTSTYWHGECPTPSQQPGPPVEEGDQPGE